MYRFFKDKEKDEIHAVLSGVLPDSCYSLGRLEVEKISDNVARLNQFANKQLTGPCVDEPKTEIPFTYELNLGTTPKESAPYGALFCPKIGPGNIRYCIETELRINN
jgi:hypothetical protein